MEAYQIKRAVWGSDEEVIVTAFAIKLTRKDLQSLSNRNWLNDQVINFYFSMIEEECNNAMKTVHVFSTFFYSRLTQNGYEGEQNWTHITMDESHSETINRNHSVLYYTKSRLN